MRALKFLVVAMGVLILMGTATLVVLIIQRAGGPGGSGLGLAVAPASAFSTVALGEPPGTRIVGMTATADRVALQLDNDGTGRVVFIDPKTNRLTGQVILGRDATPANPSP